MSSKKKLSTEAQMPAAKKRRGKKESSFPAIPESLSTPQNKVPLPQVPSLLLRNAAAADVRIPQLGFGTYRLRKGDVIKPLSLALQAGYRMLDTAQIYDNEKQIGECVSSFPFSGEVFITTKLWRSHQGSKEIVKKNLQQSIKKLQRKEVDLWLLHWPGAGQHMLKRTPVPKDWSPAMRIDTWKTMVECQQEGKVKAVGVSNFSQRHLEELKEKTGTLPAVNQVELHPLLAQSDLVEYCNKEGIILMAYCSLGVGDAEILQHSTVKMIAQKHGKTNAQVLLRWGIQKGFVVIPCSTSQAHIEENMALWDFVLGDQDILSPASSCPRLLSPPARSPFKVDMARYARLKQFK